MLATCCSPPMRAYLGLGPVSKGVYSSFEVIARARGFARARAISAVDVCLSVLLLGLQLCKPFSIKGPFLGPFVGFWGSAQCLYLM